MKQTNSFSNRCKGMNNDCCSTVCMCNNTVYFRMYYDA